jgi:hypothetical protein
MGGDKVFISLKAARGTIISSKFGSELLKCWKARSPRRFSEAAARLTNMLRFFAQILAPDGKMGRESHRKLVDEVGLVCFALSEIAGPLASATKDPDAANNTAACEISAAATLLSDALAIHAHRLKPKAGESLKAARLLLTQLPHSHVSSHGRATNSSAVAAASADAGDAAAAAAPHPPPHTALDAGDQDQARAIRKEQEQGEAVADQDDDVNTKEELSILARTQKVGRPDGCFSLPLFPQHFSCAKPQRKQHFS